MFNFNDFKVEQEIAQERYQTLVRARQIDAALNHNSQKGSISYQRVVDWVGRQWIEFACYLKKSRGVVVSSACQ